MHNHRTFTAHTLRVQYLHHASDCHAVIPKWSVCRLHHQEHHSALADTLLPSPLTENRSMLHLVQPTLYLNVICSPVETSSNYFISHFNAISTVHVDQVQTLLTKLIKTISYNCVRIHFCSFQPLFNCSRHSSVKIYSFLRSSSFRFLVFAAAPKSLLTISNHLPTSHSISITFFDRNTLRKQHKQTDMLTLHLPPFSVSFQQKACIRSFIRNTFSIIVDHFAPTSAKHICFVIIYAANYESYEKHSNADSFNATIFFLCSLSPNFFLIRKLVFTKLSLLYSNSFDFVLASFGSNACQSSAVLPLTRYFSHARFPFQPTLARVFSNS